MMLGVNAKRDSTMPEFLLGFCHFGFAIGALLIKPVI